VKGGAQRPQARAAASAGGATFSPSTPPDVAAFLRDEESRRGDLAVGAILGLVTLAMMFAGLLFAYAYLRASQAGGWPPPGAVRLPRLAPALATVSVIGGATALFRGIGRNGRTLVATAIGTIAFQALTLFQAYEGGLRPGSGALGSVVFALTAVHGLHLVGLLLLVAIALRGREGRHRASGPLIWTSHLLGGFWVAIYLGVYVF